VPVAVVTLSFDPTVDLAGRAILIETIALAIAILVALTVAAAIAHATPRDSARRRLRLDDMLFIVLGIVPGAVVGARLGYVLLHLDFYRSQPGAILNPAQGGLELTLGILGGVLTGAYVARLLEAPVGRWAHAAALPVLVAIAGGKLAQALDGAGQGVPTDLSWATAYAGPGPWGSLAPGVPSHPSQLYEAGVASVVFVACAALLATGAFKRRDGRLLSVALGGWIAGRFVVAFSWRDATVLGPLRAEQVILLAALLVLGALWVVFGRRSMRSGVGSADTPAWPDPDVSRHWRDAPHAE
jgi:phosphatidylglycerol---prolipoprotein diacylglyceryl transferase